jgi:predicted transcriptional regulator of viral defense system
MQTSKMESNLLESVKVKSLVVFSVKDLCGLLNLERSQVYGLIKSLKKKNLIKVLKNGVYSMNDIDEIVLAPYTARFSYVSFLSALNFYGLSDQMPQKILLATVSNTRSRNYIFAKLSKKFFFGYTIINNIIIADVEKAIIDCLYMPRYSGGIKEVRNALRNINSYNQKKLICYALKMERKAVIRRLGYLLEELGQGFNKQLNKHIGRGYELLDPGADRKNNYNAKWLLDVNA